jgi:hypothetical protein
VRSEVLISRKIRTEKLGRNGTAGRKGDRKYWTENIYRENVR